MVSIFFSRCLIIINFKFVFKIYLLPNLGPLRSNQIKSLLLISDLQNLQLIVNFTQKPVTFRSASDEPIGAFESPNRK